MNIAVYGATGNAGTEIVAEATRRGHTVLAVSRHEPSTALPGGTTWEAGDAADTAGVREVSARADAVVLALGPSREAGAEPTAFIGLAQAFAASVGATRLVVLGGAGSLHTESGERLVDTAGFPAANRPEALAHAEVLEQLRVTDLSVDWTYLSPAPELVVGERTGSYRTGGEHPIGGHISFADCAIALIDEVETPAHRRERWTVATS